jgi:hypothetical protein
MITKTLLLTLASAFDGVNWHAKLPVHSAWARKAHAMAYDSVRGTVVLFGGSDSFGHRGDTWEWDGVDWLQRTPPTRPSARHGHRMVFDPVAGVFVLFGGSDATGRRNDLWQWDGANWTQRLPPASPPARSGCAMVYDSANQSMLLFGGYNGGRLGDTWIYASGQFASAAAYGSGCGTPPFSFSPDANARPMIGQVAMANITNAPTLAAGVAMGWNDTTAFSLPLPIDLSFLGMPGCDLLHSNEVFGLTAAPTSASTLSFQAAIPYQPSLLGSHVYIQAYAFAPGANPLQFVVSNAIDWLIGIL